MQQVRHINPLNADGMMGYFSTYLLQRSHPPTSITAELVFSKQSLYVMKCGLDVLGNRAGHCKLSSKHLSALFNPRANALADQNFNKPQPRYQTSHTANIRKTEPSHLSPCFPIHKPNLFQHGLTFYFQTLFDKVRWLVYVNSSIMGCRYNLTLV